jgi:hypothetical protein
MKVRIVAPRLRNFTYFAGAAKHHKSSGEYREVSCCHHHRNDSWRYRLNVIPESVQMDGTIRAFDQDIHKEIQTRVKNTAALIAKSAGASAEVTIVELYDVTVNDEALTERMLPTLSRAADGHLAKMDLIGGAEDFPFFGKEVPAFFFFLGVTPKDRDPKTAPANHSPTFFVDESARSRLEYAPSPESHGLLADELRANRSRAEKGRHRSNNMRTEGCGRDPAGAGTESGFALLRVHSYLFVV